MVRFTQLRRFTVRCLRVSVLWAGLGLGGSTLAQGPAPSQLPKITYTKNTIFHLPVQMDERTRANVREICLYVKSGTGDWVRQETGLPNMTQFNYRVPRDGEYWFSLVTIDKAGRMTPADVSQEPPGLRVMVDTQPPVIDVEPYTSPEGEFCLRCQVRDANADPKSIKASYHDQAGDHAVEAVPGAPGLFKVVGRELLNQPLRITASDLCGNTASREVNVRDMAVAALQPKTPATAPLTMPPPLPTAPVPTAPVPTVETARTEVHKTAFSTLPPIPDSARTLPAPPPLPPATASTVPALPTSLPMLPTIPPAPGSAKELAAPNPAGAAAPSNSPKQIINTTHATIDYRIDQVGPSGVGRVEVYLTSDGGLNWQRLQEDPDRRSPAEIDLPGEGLFGIRLVITNGNGFGGTPPVRGEAPTCWIEVDTTVPFVQMRPIEAAQNGVMELRWSASDKNLTAEPVSLYYRTRPDGPWQAIARNLKNDGAYRWKFPRDQGSQFFVKIEVADLAGNISHVQTPNPIVLDITEPRATVLGITGMSRHVTPPTGN